MSRSPLICSIPREMLHSCTGPNRSTVDRTIRPSAPCWTFFFRFMRLRSIESLGLPTGECLRSLGKATGLESSRFLTRRLYSEHLYDFAHPAPVLSIMALHHAHISDHRWIVTACA